MDFVFHLRPEPTRSPKAVPSSYGRNTAKACRAGEGALGRLTVRAIRKHNGARGRWVDRWRKGRWGNVKEAQNLVWQFNTGWSGDTENAGEASAL